MRCRPAASVAASTREATPAHTFARGGFKKAFGEMPPAGEKEAKMPKEVLRAFSVRVPPAQLKLITAWAAKQPVPPPISEAIRRLAEIGMQNPTGVLHRILGAISETTHEKIGADPVLQKKIAERLKEVENELKPVRDSERACPDLLDHLVGPRHQHLPEGEAKRLILAVFRLMMNSNFVDCIPACAPPPAGLQ
jgi:hypothetical protein